MTSCCPFLSSCVAYRTVRRYMQNVSGDMAVSHRQEILPEECVTNKNSLILLDMLYDSCDDILESNQTWTERPLSSNQVKYSRPDTIYPLTNRRVHDKSLQRDTRQDNSQQTTTIHQKWKEKKKKKVNKIFFYIFFLQFGLLFSSRFDVRKT